MNAAMPKENTHAATIDQKAIAIGFGIGFGMRSSLVREFVSFCGRVGSTYSGGRNPGELAHASRWAAVSACRAFFSRSSLSGPGLSCDAFPRVFSANAARRSFRDVDCFGRRRSVMTLLRVSLERARNRPTDRRWKPQALRRRF